VCVSITWHLRSSGSERGPLTGAIPHGTYAVITVVFSRQIRYNTAMSEKQKYNTVERYRLDTWAFIVFMAVCVAVAHL